MREAMLCEQISNCQVRCYLCAHRCVIGEGKVGICRVRENRDGKLYTHVYGTDVHGPLIAPRVGPIERHPLFHFFPGSLAYGVAAPGCNFRCEWCQSPEMPRRQKWMIGRHATPEAIVDEAIAHGCQSIVYTGAEPTIFFEYAYDIAGIADSRGLHNVVLSNGYMTEEMLSTFHPFLDAVSVDLKAFRDETYRRSIGARLQPVLDSLRLMRRLGLWIEVTTRIVPTFNDDPDELCEAAAFIAQELGPQTPWHLDYLYPGERLEPVEENHVAALAILQHMALESGLRHVYVSNGDEQGQTSCHQCASSLVRRSRGTLLEDRVTQEGRCPDCHAPVAGVGMGGAKAARVWTTEAAGNSGGVGGSPSSNHPPSSGTLP